MSFYTCTKTETLKTIKANLSKQFEFTGNYSGSYEARQGWNMEDFRHLKMIEEELKRRADDPGVFEREEKARERSKKHFG